MRRPFRGAAVERPEIRRCTAGQAHDVALTVAGQAAVGGKLVALRSIESRRKGIAVDEVSFTAGITFQDDRVVTVDVTAIDGDGMTYVAEKGPGRVPWADVKAVMMATTDHMLESAGSLFAMAERLEAAGDEGAGAASEMRRFGFGVLQQAAPRMCPLGAGCGLRSGQALRPDRGSPS